MNVKELNRSPQQDNFKPKIIRVVEEDMCIACGACVAACPDNVIEPTYNQEREVFEVKVNDYKKCMECRKCDPLCPSIEVNFPEIINKESSEQKEISNLGPMLSIHTGYSSEHQHNNISSSGGIIRAFITEAIEHNKPVICLGKTEDGYNAILAESIQDLSRIPGSIYHSTSFSNCIHLLKTLDRPCLLVAIPCQLEGISNYIHKIEPHLKDNIDLVVGLICGWMYSKHAIQAFTQYKNIDYKDVSDVNYRGDDRVGFLKLFTKKETLKFSRRKFDTINDFIDYAASFSRSLNRLRCRVCENHINIFSDLSVGDAWLKKYRTEKKSIIVCRTKKGESALQHLAHINKVALEKSDLNELTESQSKDFVYGDSARQINSFLLKKKYQTPKFIFSIKIVGTKLNKLATHANMFLELMFRSLIKKRRYRVYRFLYIFSNIGKIIKYFIRIIIFKNKI